VASGSNFQEERPLLQLIRSADRVYAQAIRASLNDAGFDDLPPRGIAVVIGLRRGGVGVGHLSRGLGVTSQAASQLLDTLVARSYVERAPDPADRRRIVVSLTPRGEEAAAIAAQAMSRVDEQLDRTLSSEQRRALRVGLAALAELAPPPPRPESA